MAVTQQLARVDAEHLAACRTSAGTSPDGDPRWDPPSADVLELDWAAALLERVCDLADLDSLNTHPHDIDSSGHRQLPSPQNKWPASPNC
ncbi:hypothetical protein [Streptomyces sp. GESEQ-35]|uniref:hypothetical protein n=1 Tax=Streptomyces sp. GESEQ-35 TaxID=2812657 RepID=UPI001B31A485|nr:hypothetical protein [Streptomyces sp. GESEQ-35]